MNWTLLLMGVVLVGASGWHLLHLSGNYTSAVGDRETCESYCDQADGILVQMERNQSGVSCICVFADPD